MKLQNQQIAMPSPYQKFDIKFSHEQYLHNLRGKLCHAQSILVNTRDTIKLVREHGSAMELCQDFPAEEHSNFRRDLDSLSREVDCHIGTSNKLLRMSDDLKSMANFPQYAQWLFEGHDVTNSPVFQYNNILTFHNQELQRDASLKLTHLAQADAVESKNMAVLADLTYKDSRTMRIATVIAMFYLPANLVMVCCLYLSTACKLHRSFTHLPFGGSVCVGAYHN